MERMHSLPPIVDERSKVLILGTFPGNDSLKAKQYYNHENNLFWDIIVRIVDKSWPEIRMADSLDYEERISLLLEHHIALWDILESCEREGNVDSKIYNPKYNDIVDILKRFPNIEKVCFNGSLAHSYFNKYMNETGTLLSNKLKIEEFYSTSPSSQVNSFYILKQWLIGVSQVLNNFD